MRNRLISMGRKLYWWEIPIGMCLLACLIGLGMLVTRPVTAQPPTVVMLGDAGGSPQLMRAASLTNFPVSTTLTARSVLGAALEAMPSQWIAQSNPASGSQATASIAAEAGVRHVAQCVGWSAAASGIVTAAQGTVILRDGATGAGTVLQPWAIAHIAAGAAGIQTVAPTYLCGLSLTGTTNTAMTLEFNAGVTGEVQAVWVSGINIQ